MSEKVNVKEKAPTTAVEKTEKKVTDVSNDVAKELRTLRLSPRTDILETKEDFLVHIDMPGVGKDGAKVDFEEGVITVRGRADCSECAGEGHQHRTYDVKEYYRSFHLTEGIDFGKIEADIQGGVLNITLPKAEEARPRQIPVKAS